MIIQSHQNASGSVIAITGTATLLYDLINTAASTGKTRAGFDVDTNGVDLVIENGSVRVLFDGNTPTAALGILLPEGTHRIRNVDLATMKLIRTGSSNVSASVQVGKANATEASTFEAADTTSSNSAGNGGDLPAEGLMVGGEVDDPTALAAATEGKFYSLVLDLARRLIVTLGTQIDSDNDSISTEPIKGAEVGDGSQVASLEVAATSGVLLGFWVTNNSGATVYYQLFDNGSLPADTTVPDAPSVPVGNGVTTFIDLRSLGSFTFSSGCYIVASSTIDDKTITGATSQIKAWKE